VGLGGKAGSAGGIVLDTFSAGDIPVSGTATEIAVDTTINGDGSQNIKYGGAAGTVIGTCKGGTPQEPLIVKFNTAATEAIVEAVFQNVCFLNTSTTPMEGTRRV